VKRWCLYLLTTVVALVDALTAVSLATWLGFGPLVGAVRRAPSAALRHGAGRRRADGARRFTSSTHTALIFAAEPVFAVLFSFLLIGEVLGPRQLLGCGLILAGMVVAEMRCGSERRTEAARQPS